MTLRETRVVTIGSVAEDLAALSEAAGICREGGLVAFPTETVYGLGTNALDPEAVARLHAVKERPAAQPFSVIVASVADALPLVKDISEAAAKLMQAFLPGPLTIILPSSGRIPTIVTGGSGKVGIRVPDHAIARSFVQACGCPVAAPSANRHGRPSPRTGAEVLAQLGGLIDVIVDGGPTDLGLDSSVIDATSHPPTLLREGAVSAGVLEAALGQALVRA